MLIEYNGQSIETEFYKELTDAEFESYRNEYYKKPSFESVKKQFLDISRGGTTNNLVTDYYVKDLMLKTKMYHCKWSLEDVWNCKELVSRFYALTLANEKVYPITNSVIKNIETAMRIGGKGVAQKPSNFPLKTVDYILDRYNVNNNWYDFSCGWGARLTGALKNNVNYFGTDPNYLLVPRLQQLADDYLATIRNDEVVDLFGVNDEQTKVDIRCQGSEEFVAEWEGKIGVAFSSPPYFYLEDYKIGNQSYTEGTTYEQWKSNYLLPTMQNIYRYLVSNGYYILNINNFDKYTLVEDCIELAQSIGFKYKEDAVLDNIKRCTEVGFNDNNERIMVFTK